MWPGFSGLSNAHITPLLYLMRYVVPPTCSLIPVIQPLKHAKHTFNALSGACYQPGPPLLESPRIVDSDAARLFRVGRRPHYAGGQHRTSAGGAKGCGAGSLPGAVAGLILD